MEKEREFVFTDKDFNWLRELAYQRMGITLSEAKRELVYSRLSRRLRQVGLDSFKDYCTLLQDGDEGEMINFTNAITTNLTAFFREAHHFEHMKTVVLPELFKKKSHARRLRIWSAGCSTGEEPYSIAMVVKESVPRDWDVKILATDIDSNVLATAQQGIYNEDRVKGIQHHYLKRWFVKGKGSNAGVVRVSSELRDMITFQQLNLMEKWPIHGPLDIIFCRNVVIYFNKETQKNIFNRFADLIDMAGHLFIGHSESLHRVTDRFELLGKTIYQRVR
jgi:chemotaxis protein methyltransferase CheR